MHFGFRAGCAVALLAVIGLCSCGGSTPPPAPAEAPPPLEATPTAAPAADTAVAATGDLAWEFAFDDVKGWYDNATDQTYHATIAAEAGGKARVTEAGPEAWGKVAIFCPGIDFARGPVLEVVVDSVDGATWKAGIVPQPWDDAQYKTLVASTPATGSTTADLASTGWTGPKDVNLVLVVEGEGKSIVLDSIRIRYTK